MVPTWKHGFVLALCLLAAPAGLAACGGGSGGAETTSPTATSTAAGDTAGGTAEAGAAVWEKAGCGSCHVLAAAGSDGSVGPNLDDLKPDLTTVVTQVTVGGGGMPAFKDQLSEQEIAAVAAYVVKSTSG